MISDEYFIEMNKKNLEKKKRKVEAKLRGDAFELVMFNLLKPKYKNLIDNNIKSKYAVMDFTDNIAKLEIECKNREGNKHNDFDGDCDTNGLCFGRNKYYYAIERLKLGYKFIVYFNCSDGIFYWELTNSEKQKDEYTFGMGGNKKIGQRPTQLIYIKTKYLQKFQQ